jgi:predicted component of type VI protein secretion system
MSSLRNVEDTIGGFVERIFGRLFRGHVEPVELARKLAREMEDHKTVSVSRVYVPNEYVVYLSPSDRERFSSFEGSLTTELGVYVAERARHEGFTLLSQPKVRLETDTDLRLGEYGIACRVVDPPAEAPAEVDASTNADEAPALDNLTRFPPAPPEPPGAVVIPIAAAAASDDPDPFHDPPAEAAEGVIADELPPADAERDAVEAAGEDADGEPQPAAPEAEAEPAGDVESGAVAVAAADDGDAVAEPEFEPPGDAEPVPLPLPTVPVAELVPEPVAEAQVVPLPAPGGYEPLAGVSGTQILSAADAQAEGFVSEEVALIVDGRRCRVTQRTTTLGRSRDCDIVVQDANASRQHAEVRHIGLDYFLVDLGSTNGTIVNGQRIRRHPLAHGDRILIGTTEIVVEHLT